MTAFQRSKRLLFAILCCIILTGWTTIQKPVLASGIVQKTEENIVIVIDPGHGGENEGTIENGFQEKSMNMITATAMYEELSQFENVTVYMTRTKDVDLTLKERAEYAAQVGADFLFSIHYNASVNHNLFGSEVWISSQAPYHAYGYQFGCVHQAVMQEKGLFLRGVKTRLNDEGTDYYGIIRESVALSVPAVIIEHCHVDEDRDVPFCDEQEDWIALGKADAHAVAEYFGLYSNSLGVDYREQAYSLPNANASSMVEITLKDATSPDVCRITPKEIDYENGKVTLDVSAADYDSILLYYDYSLDGGITYSPLQPWPESNALTGTYQDTFSLTLDIPSGTLPSIQLRAYNLFDAHTVSNVLTNFQAFLYGEEMAETSTEAAPLLEQNTPEVVKPSAPIMTQEAWSPQIIEEVRSRGETLEKENSLLTFLAIILLCVVVLFLSILLLQVAGSRRRRKRRYRRNVDGNKTNQPR